MRGLKKKFDTPTSLENNLYYHQLRQSKDLVVTSSPQFLEFSPNELDKQQRAFQEMSKNPEISFSQVNNQVQDFAGDCQDFDVSKMQPVSNERHLEFVISGITIPGLTDTNA